MNRKKLQTPLANDIDATNSNIRYDTQVKTVLADKNILARILKYTVEEFSHLDVEQIKQCIEGIPEISCVAMIKNSKRKRYRKNIISLCQLNWNRRWTKCVT